MPGVRVKAVWWNARRVHNFACLTYVPEVRAAVRRRGGVMALCGGGRQRFDFPCCGRMIHTWWEAPEPGMSFAGEKVGKYWMCTDCARMWR